MDVGVIGAGNMGRKHVRVYSELKEVDTVYLYDVNLATAQRLSEKYGGRLIVSESLDSLLKRVDMVSICAPTEHHCTIAKKVLDKGIHCLIEKPLSLSREEGEQLLKYVPNGSVLGVGHIERFNPIVGEIKSLLKHPRYIEIKRLNPTSSRITDADVVSDLMIHDIDLIWNYFMHGASYELNSVWEAYRCTAVARFDSCAVSLSASRIACKKTRSIYIEDEDFSVEGDFMNQEVYIYRRPQRYEEQNARYVQENITEKVLVNKVEPLREELKMFVTCVKRGKPFPVTAEQAILNLRVAEEIRERGKNKTVLQHELREIVARIEHLRNG